MLFCVSLGSYCLYYQRSYLEYGGIVFFRNDVISQNSAPYSDGFIEIFISVAVLG